VECKFCKIYYCRNHVLAEEHGCGEVAQEDAKRQKPTQKQLELAAMKLKEKIKEQ
jgi:predicted nucleic acid binding AN1-type Zn finger protein